MILTNELNLPQAFVNACSTERHNKKGSYSATTLLKDVKEIILQERHYEEIVVDVADQVWAIWGTAVHAIFEKQNDLNFKEEFFETKVLNSKVTGRVDSYDLENETLYDFKTASIWKVKMNDFDDWRKQGLIYAWLMSKNGLNVKKCRFIALLKDHSKTEAERSSEYPQKPVYVFEFNVFKKDLEEIEKMVYNKVQALEEAENKTDDEIAECSKECRWATDGKYAVMKQGRKTAVKLFSENEKELAEAFVTLQGAGAYIEHRKGENKKCKNYCSACKFCNFYKENVEK